MTALFLVDTMVVSEGFKRKPHPEASRWLGLSEPSSLAISVVTFGEIAAGLEKQRIHALAVFDRLAVWLQDTQRDFQERTVPITTHIALRWGALCTRLKRRDTDLLIAATALEHDLTVVTRNVQHFEPAGVKLLNPYGPA